MTDSNTETSAPDNTQAPANRIPTRAWSLSQQRFLPWRDWMRWCDDYVPRDDQNNCGRHHFKFDK